MNILLTGGTGYVGRHVAQACLQRGWAVHLLTRSSSTMPMSLEGKIVRHNYKAGYEDLHAIVQRAEPDCVVHMATASGHASTPEQIKHLADTNIILPTILLEAMLQAKVSHFVNTGTFWQHYNDYTYYPVDLYAASKQSFQDLMRHYTNNRGLAAVTLKLFDNYGPSDPRKKIVTLLVEAARGGEELALSGGDQILDLTHVADVAQAFLQAIIAVLRQPAGSEATYFVSGERLSLKSLAAIVANNSPLDFQPRFGERPYREREIMVPIDPGCDRLPSWAVTRTIETTVAEMFAS